MADIFSSASVIVTCTATLKLNEIEMRLLEGMAGFDAASVYAAIKSVCGESYTGPQACEALCSLMEKCRGFSTALESVRKFRESLHA